MTTDAVAGSETSTVAGVRARVWLERLLYSANAWMIVGLAAGAAEAFNGRHAMNPDGLSYLEMAETAVRHGPAGLVSAYWSPGYPALIAATLRIARPAVAGEFPVVHALNFVILAATLWIGRTLLGAWAAGDGSPDRARSALIPIGFGVLLLILMAAVPPSLVTPDLAVVAITLLIALAYQRLETSGSWASACALGAACALGYWMKAVMFPLGAVFLVLVVATLRPADTPHARARAFAAVGTWALLCLPLIVLTSHKVGRPTFGESGHLTYAWYVLHADQVESPAPYGSALVHPPRVLLGEPRIIEFGSPIAGSFPIHYDPAYWSEGTPAHFALRPQLRAFVVSGFEYVRELLFELPLVAATLLGLLAVCDWPLLRGGRPKWLDVLLIWGASWLALYAANHVESRLAAPGFALIALSLVRALLRGAPARAAKGIAAMLAGVVLLQTASFGWLAIRRARDHGSPSYLALAKGLGALGLTPATRIAVVGHEDAATAWYAHAAGLVVAAEVIPSSVSITNDNVAAVKTALAGAGIRAIVRTGGPLGVAESEWRRIPLNDGSVAGVLFTAP